MMGMILFFLFFSSLMALLHVYLWRGLVRDPGWPRAYAKAATIVICFLGGSIPAGMALSRALPREQAMALSTVSFLWLGLLFYLVVTQMLWDVARLPYRLARRRKRKRKAGSKPGRKAGHTTAEPSDRAGRTHADAILRHSRRRFLARAAASTTLVASGGLGAWGFKSAMAEIQTPEIQVRLPRLPPALSGYRITMLCDLHLGPLLGRSFVEEVVSTANRLEPDLVAIVGDLVDGQVSHLEADARPLANLRARNGTYFVTGNHEYYSGVGPWMELLRRLGIRVLANERVSVGDTSSGGASFDLLGVPDYRAGRYHALGPDMRVAAEGRDPERELVVLAHQPVHVDDAAEIDAGLQLSGHTHGGQLYPFGFLTRVVQPYLYGLHRHSDITQIYVSRGTGFWGPPMRVLAPAEIATLVLTA